MAARGARQPLKPADRQRIRAAAIAQFKKMLTDEGMPEQDAAETAKFFINQAEKQRGQRG